MKAISDKKIDKTIQKLLACDATYALGNQEGKITLNEALIAEAKKMTHGKERRVLFDGSSDGVFDEAWGGIAKLYMHQYNSDSVPGSVVCVELFSGSQRSYMNVLHNIANDSWSCTERVVLGDGIRTTCYVSNVNATQAEVYANSAKIAHVMVTDAQMLRYTVVIDIDYLRDYEEVHGYWLPWNGELLVTFEPETGKLILTAEAGIIGCVHCYY